MTDPQRPEGAPIPPAGNQPVPPAQYPQQPAQYAPQPGQPQQYAPQPGQPAQYAPQPGQPQQYVPQPGQPQQYAQQPQQYAPQYAPQPGQPMPYQAQPAPVAPTPAVDGARFRVHSSYIWMQLVGAVVGILAVASVSVGPLLEASFEMQDAGAPPIGLIALLTCGGVVLILGLCILMQILSWKNLWYQFDESEFSLYSGIITKKKVHIPYRRVQSVNHTASLLQRAVGVCSVSIDTAGGAANKAVRIPYVTNAAAEQIRYELFARKQMLINAEAQAASAATAAASVPVSGAGAPNPLEQVAGDLSGMRGAFGGAAIDTGVVTCEYGLSGGELFLTGLSNSAAQAGAIVASLFGIVAMVFQFLPVSALDGFDSAFGSVAADVQEIMSIMSYALWGIFISVIGLVLFTWAVSILSTCLNYGGFRARRRGSRIEVEHGLLQRQFSGIDIERVQSVVIKQSFLRRMMGYCELSLGRIDSVTEGSEGGANNAKLNKGGLVVHPFVKKKRVAEVLAGLAPEFADIPLVEDRKPLPSVALRRAIVRGTVWRSGSLWMLIITVLILKFGEAGLVALVTAGNPSDAGYAVREVQGFWPFVANGLFGLAVILALSVIIDIIRSVLWKRGSGFAYNHRFMTIWNSGFSTEQISFPRQKIQYGNTKRNPFQQHSRVATINARLASGVGGTTHTLWDVSEDDASAWLDWLKPRGNMVQ